MTRRTIPTLAAIVFVAAQITVTAQSKPATTAKPAPAKAAPAKTAIPAKPTVAQAQPAGSMTLTGCLQADGPKWKLNDVEGAQAPKARSWKTGFITKRSRDLEVVAASNNLKLADFRGHKVSVVGVQDGDMYRARSIKQVSKTCS